MYLRMRTQGLVCCVMAALVTVSRANALGIAAAGGGQVTYIDRNSNGHLFGLVRIGSSRGVAYLETVPTTRLRDASASTERRAGRG